MSCRRCLPLLLLGLALAAALGAGSGAQQAPISALRAVEAQVAQTRAGRQLQSAQGSPEDQQWAALEGCVPAPAVVA
jgi:hypothetical protein